MNSQAIVELEIFVPILIEYHNQDYLMNATFPKRITLELTNQCNISCTFCPRHEMGNLLGMMDSTLAIHLIDEMAEHLPLAIVPFFRGESLLHPQWWKIIEHAKRKGLGPIQFTTNATLLDKTNAQRLLDCGVDFISFSLDTVEPSLYEASRRGAKYATTISNILSFLEMHSLFNSEMTVQVSAVETAEHVAGMDQFVDYWLPKVDRVRVYAEHSSDGKPGSMRAQPEHSCERKPCMKVYEDMVILWNGDVAICNHDWQRQKKTEVFANVSMNGICEAWLCKEYQALREAHEKGFVEGITPCDSCEQWKAFYVPEHLIGRLYTK